MIILYPDVTVTNNSPPYPLGMPAGEVGATPSPSFVLQDDGGDFILLDDDGSTDRLVTGM